MEKEQSLTEFRMANQVDPKKRKIKVTGSFGVYDAYKLMRKNHWFDIGRPVKECEYYAIIRGVNKLLAENIAKGIPVVFPENMGKIDLFKTKVGVTMVDGKLKNTYPIDWNATWKLWYEDEEAMKAKILIRDEQEYVYRTKYCKGNATYENKQFYLFVLNSFIRRALKINIKRGKVDTLWLRKSSIHQ